MKEADREFAAAAEKPDGVDPVDALREEATDLLRYATVYASARRDILLAIVRRYGVIAAGAIIALPAAVALLASASALFVYGLAGWIAHLLRWTPWAGFLVVGTLVWILAAAGFLLTKIIIERNAYRAAIRKYGEGLQ